MKKKKRWLRQSVGGTVHFCSLTERERERERTRHVTPQTVKRNRPSNDVLTHIPRYLISIIQQRRKANKKNHNNPKNTHAARRPTMTLKPEEIPIFFFFFSMKSKSNAFALGFVCVCVCVCVNRPTSATFYSRPSPDPPPKKPKKNIPVKEKWINKKRVAPFRPLNRFGSFPGREQPVIFSRKDRVWVLLGFTGFYRVLLGFTGFYWVLLGFTGFYWVLVGFPGFYRVQWIILLHLRFTAFGWPTIRGNPTDQNNNCK